MMLIEIPIDYFFNVLQIYSSVSLCVSLSVSLPLNIREKLLLHNGFFFLRGERLVACFGFCLWVF